MRSRLFVLHCGVPFQHFQVVRSKHVGVMAGKNLVIGKADDLIRFESENLFKAAVDQHIAAAGLFDVDHSGRRVSHLLQQLLAAAEGIFRALPLHD